MPQRKQTKQPPPPQQHAADTLDPKNDFNKIGPGSIEGVEASQFPDKGRGSIETDPGHEGKRNIPQRTGNITGNVGLRGDPDLAEADKKGGRKHN
jgi:hypothetical protein